MKLDDHTLTALAATPVPSPGLWFKVREDVACVCERDPAARTKWEVWTIYPGVQAVLIYRMAHALWLRGWQYLPRWMSFVARFLTQVDIHPGASIGRRFFIDHGVGVVIGETAVIGDDVTLYHGVTLGGTTWSPGKRHPTLGDGVVVGAGAKILGPIEIGARARIAANSVVIHAVPADATVVGIPGRIVVPKDRRLNVSAGIDLNHHLIPDPVGRAIACLLERIDVLETQLAIHPAPQGSVQSAHSAEAAASPAPTPCVTCGDICHSSDSPIEHPIAL